MRTHLTGVGLLLLLATNATAGPPSGYQCDPGTASRGTCSCPTGFESRRDAKDRAICYAVDVAPAPAPPPPPPPPPQRPPTIRIALTVTAKPPIAATAKPELDAEQALSIEGLSGTIRGEQEQILEQLLDNTPDTEVEEKSDYYFRLGELHAKQLRYWRLKGDEKKTRDYLKKTVTTFRTLTENDKFRNYPKMDMALFYYGYSLQSAGLMKEARAIYDKLLKNYPNSKYVPQAHLVFAEYYFDANQLADAEARYKMVLKFPLSSAYWFAMYKMGWIHHSLQRYQEALETFFQVAQATKNDAKQAPLNRAAKRGFVRAYAEIGKLDKAYAAFSRVDKDGEAMTESLADVFLEQGKFEKTIAVYQELLKQSPTSPSACLWMSSSARASAYLNSGKLVDVCAQEIQTLKEWARANGGALTN